MLTTETSTVRPSCHEAHLRARRERSLMTHALTRRLTERSAHMLQALAHRSTRLMHRLANEWYQRRAIHALYQLDDRMLSDIGLSRGEIETVVRLGPPWRAGNDKPDHGNAGRSASPLRQAA